jgi:hypothetical protein
VNSWVERVLVAASLVCAGWALVLVVRDKGVDLALLVGAALVEAVVLVQLVVGIVDLVGSHRDIARLTYLGYLVGAIVIAPLGVAWGAGEKNRYGSSVLLVAFLLMPVMVLRLEGIWAGTHV